MTKVSEVRSAIRRAALVKAADEYSDMLNARANAYRGGITGAGVRLSTNDALKRQGYGVTAEKPVVKKKTYPPMLPAKYNGAGGYSRMLHEEIIPEGIANFKRRTGKIMNWIRSKTNPAPKLPAPVVGTAITPTVR